MSAPGVCDAAGGVLLCDKLKCTTSEFEMIAQVASMLDEVKAELRAEEL